MKLEGQQQISEKAFKQLIEAQIVYLSGSKSKDVRILLSGDRAVTVSK